ncbi:MAG: tripartite tricarboxylate transporter TctB family protein [Haloferacaceae archaeon]
MSEVTDRSGHPIEGIEDRYWEALFFLVLLAYDLVLVYTATGYGEDPRLFPLLIGIPLAGLILVRVGMLVFADRFDFDSGGMFESVTSDLDVEEGGEAPPSKLAQYRSELATIGWIAGFLVLVWALGFQISVVAFVFAYVLVYERDLKRAVLATAIAFGLVYLLFIELLSVPLYEGALLPEFLLRLLQ